MTVWGVQKIGQATIGTKTVPILQPDVTSTIFRRPTIGSGCDERAPTGPSEATQESEFTEISKIDKAIRQFALLKGLTGDQWGSNDKIVMIQKATGVEGLLPGNSVQSMDIRAGGLLEDWDFKF